MPHDKDRIAQGAGFIEKANERRDYHQEKATTARTNGWDSNAERHEAAAGRLSEQVSKAANRIYEKTSERKK